ncbi:MAG: DegT/DnrJ/EryC1/StrS family aminotransferase [Alphaproteobacteria bacterium]
MSDLALLGGRPVRTKLFPAHNFIGAEEQDAVRKVLESGVLSKYLGAWHPHFYGGPEVRAFEDEWAEMCGAKHGVAVNSNTSGLLACAGAMGVGPGDEVIVPPITMSATATAPLIFNAVPVFADVDPTTFCIDAASVRDRITPRTKAIIVVHILGNPVDMDPIMEIANEHGLMVLEDCAQVPTGTYKGRPLGTIGNLGVFSLNYHKHVHTGEGGVVVTNDDDLAERVRLIRNHAESVVAGRPGINLINMVGFNLRMTEVEAAIGRCQIKKAPDLVRRRRENVAYLEGAFDDFPGVTIPKTAPGRDSCYYFHHMFYDEDETGVPRPLLVDALRAELAPYELREDEGTLINYGYGGPLYMLPMFQTKTAFGDVSCPFRCPHYGGDVDYSAGICPNAERSHATVITHDLMKPSLAKEDLDDVARAFNKVFARLDDLRGYRRDNED